MKAVSDPNHSRYGQHLSADEVNDFVKPSEEALGLVHEWLLDHGIETSNLRYTPAKDWIKIKLSAAEVEELLETEYSTYVRDDGLYAVRTPKWSLPMHLHEHITTIQPTNSFFGPRAAAPLDKRDSQAIAGPALSEADLPPLPDSGDVAEVCDVNLVTPTCVRTLYGTINYTVQAADKNTMSFTNYLGEVQSRSDAAKMLERYRPEAAAQAYEYKKVSIDGGPINDEFNETQLADRTGLEGNLDVQSLISIAWPTPLISYSTGGSPPFIPDAFTPENTNEPYLVWLDYILSLPDPLPSVVSTSYGDDEQTIPKDYAVETCKQFAQLGARGVTVLFASGDNGIGRDEYCVSNDGKNTSTFLPSYPSTCPYITSVGGTYKTNPEVAVFRQRPGRPAYSAGGGFSYYFKRPKYQDKAVPAYIKNTVGPLGYEGLFNPEGRGYPDIAGQSLNYS
jgi:tripeptidyl-peptidase I